MKRPYSFACVAMLIVCPAWAVDISFVPVFDGKFEAVSLSNDIQPRDAEKLVRFLAKNQPRSRKASTAFALSSPGGDVAEAARLAAVIEGLLAQVIIPKGELCASSCFFLYLAGNGRSAEGTIDGKYYGTHYGALAVHRPYFAPEAYSDTRRMQSAQDIAMATIRTYLEKRHVPRSIIDQMMARASTDAYVLTIEDIEQLGDSSAWRQELYIARCGYDTKLAHRMALARARGATGELDSLRAQMRIIFECTADLEHFSRQTFFDRLLTGWRPWHTVDSKASR